LKDTKDLKDLKIVKVVRDWHEGFMKDSLEGTYMSSNTRSVLRSAVSDVAFGKKYFRASVSLAESFRVQMKLWGVAA